MEKQQQYNDGVLSVYSVVNSAVSGNMPKKVITIKQPGLRYEEQIVGITRFWAAMQSNTRISKVLRAPRINSVMADDVAVLMNGSQYEIKQVQYPPDVVPPSMDLSLESIGEIYEIV